MAVKFQGGKAVPANPIQQYSRQLDLAWSDLIRIGGELRRVYSANKEAIDAVPGARQAMEEAQEKVRTVNKLIRQFS